MYREDSRKRPKIREQRSLCRCFFFLTQEDTYTGQLLAPSVRVRGAWGSGAPSSMQRKTTPPLRHCDFGADGSLVLLLVVSIAKGPIDDLGFIFTMEWGWACQCQHMFEKQYTTTNTERHTQAQDIARAHLHCRTASTATHRYNSNTCAEQMNTMFTNKRSVN